MKYPPYIRTDMKHDYWRGFRSGFLLASLAALALAAMILFA